jgi:RNA-directed DNA polymerase
MRVIAQPAKEVKTVQRWLIANDLTWMPLHRAASAYVPGASIRENAGRHVHNRYLLKVDFANFFPSIKDADLRAHIHKFASDRYSPPEVEFLCRMLLWRPATGLPLELCIGAPSSPLVSNTIMHDFDVTMSEHCEQIGVTYSRYADDLALSTNRPGILEPLTDFLHSTLAAISYPRLRLNEAKTVLTSKKFRRSVTGLALANQGYVSLGRERKRLISAMVHHFSLESLPGEERRRLAGLLAFVQDVEPLFLERLNKKYSAEVVSRARSMNSARA